MKQVKNHMGALIDKNALVDDGRGLITVKGGLTLTDDSMQHNGTRYDIKSLDVDSYDGRLFADHGGYDGYTIQSVIGTLQGVKKKGQRVVAESIQYALQNPLGLFAYNMTLGGFLTDFSIGTMGPPPDDEGVYHNASIFEVSQVGIGNNANAKINELAVNTIEQAKDQGLDTSELEKLLHINETAKPQTSSNDKELNDMKFVTIKNSRDFPVKVSYKNASDEDTEQELACNATVDVSEEQKDVVEKQINEAVAPKAEKKSEEDTREDLSEQIKNAVEAATSPLMAQIKDIEQNAFDKGAQEPMFTIAKNSPEMRSTAKNELASMDWHDRTGLQVSNAWDALKSGSRDAQDKLHAINLFHLDDLKKEGIVRNSMTIADFGNFVISREMLAEIQGCRNDYTALVNATTWRETLSTQMAWLNRSGDIDMTNVEFCDDDADGNLKPISEYTATIRTADLEELAAVTPVCNAATRFLAADLLGDVAAGYRNDYDRKRAQLVVARLEQAVDANGNSVVYDINPQIGGVTAFLDLWMEVATCTPDGTFIMSVSSYAEFVKQAVTAGISGPLAQLVTTGNQETIFGRPYILVPDDLMPKLNTAQTKTFVVDGSNVTINHAVFYARPSNFTGRVSGGLQYDLSTDAAYEVSSTVKSAFQRNELVLRGSFFRGGAVLDNNQVAGILSPGLS